MDVLCTDLNINQFTMNAENYDLEKQMEYETCIQIVRFVSLPFTN